LRYSRHSTGFNPERPYWTHDVLERLLADVFEGNVELARGILPDLRRDADAARLRQAFEPCRNVHTVPENVPILDYDVAHVNADAELDALVRRHRPNTAQMMPHLRS
jgi:hypothetical protein